MAYQAKKSKKKIAREKARAKINAELKKEQAKIQAQINKDNMAKDKAKVLARKKAEQTEAKAKAKPAVTQRLVAERNIERYKALGYKIVNKNPQDKQGKILGVRVHDLENNTSELTLMEKKG